MTSQEPFKIHPALCEEKLAEARRAIEVDPYRLQPYRAVSHWTNNLELAQQQQASS